jgi:outer membrane lipoprotein LolB
LTAPSILASRGSRFAQLAGFLFAIIFIAGCAHKQASTATNDPENQLKNGPWAGRISVQIQSEPPQGFFAGFELKGSPEQGELKLLSPIGSVLGFMRWTPTEALLETGRDVQHFSSVDALLEQATGAPIPTTALFDWLHGKNTETNGWSADLTRQNSGRITARRLEPAPQIDLRIVLDQ